MTFVLIATDQEGQIYVGGDKSGQPFATQAEAQLVSSEHYGWINADGVFGKAKIMEISPFADPHITTEPKEK